MTIRCVGGIDCIAKVDCRKSLPEKGPMEKVRRWRRSVGEGPWEKFHRRRSVGRRAAGKECCGMAGKVALIPCEEKK